MIIEAINRITSDKVKRCVYPTHALVSEVSKAIGQNRTETLAKLKELSIWVGRTLNDKYVK